MLYVQELIFFHYRNADCDRAGSGPGSDDRDTTASVCRRLHEKVS